MGYDVYVHSEVKIKGEWHHYAALSVTRNYRLFAKMAGVRNDPGYGITPIAEPRGLPKDATFLTKFDSDKYRPDGHSHSWLSAEEIYELDQWGRSVGFKGDHGVSRWMENWGFGYLFGNPYSGFAEFPDDNPKGLQDVRLVFFFDN